MSATEGIPQKRTRPAKTRSRAHALTKRARVAPDMQKRVSVDIIAGVASSFINTYWNVYSFFVLYARLDRFDPRAPVEIARRPDSDRIAPTSRQRH
jgi:isoleucyl-tRNA synthetase